MAKVTKYQNSRGRETIFKNSLLAYDGAIVMIVTFPIKMQFKENVHTFYEFYMYNFLRLKIIINLYEISCNCKFKVE